MDTGVYTRYPLDPTAINRDNLVVDEPHDLADLDLRFVVPKHGPFYRDSLVIYDAVTNKPLIKSTPTTPGAFTVPIISQEATLKLGHAVADAALILDKTVSSKVKISYQVVGGHYARNIDNIANIFDAFINDNRAIDWVKGVFGKPTEYPPGPHPHYITDIFGFETLNFVLERIYQAILLGNVPAYEMIFDALKNNQATKQDIEQGMINTKVVTLDVMQHAAQLYNFNSIKLTPMEAIAGNGRTVNFHVSCTHAPLTDRLYWTIEHITTAPDDFVLNSGSFTLYKGEGDFTIQTALTLKPEGNEKFRVLLRRGGPDRFVVMSSFEFTIPAHSSMAKNRILDAIRVTDLSSPLLRRAPLILANHRAFHSFPHS